MMLPHKELRKENIPYIGLYLVALMFVMSVFNIHHIFLITLGNCIGLGERPYSPPWWGQLAWFILFAAMLLLAILGNTLVIWIVLAHCRMRSVTNWFLVNLAVADLLIATLAPNFIFLVTADSFSLAL